MPITEKKNPYEALFRWHPETGAFQGAHVQFFHAIFKDGIMISGQPGASIPIGGDAGFPLSEIMGTITSDALALVKNHADQLFELTLSKQAAEQSRDAAQAQVAALQEQLAGLQPPGDINGIPQVISKRQGRAQLKSEGLLAPVESYIASLPPDADTRMAYEDASTWIRTDSNVVAMLQLLGKSDADADAFFVAASAR